MKTKKIKHNYGASLSHLGVMCLYDEYEWLTDENCMSIFSLEDRVYEGIFIYSYPEEILNEINKMEYYGG